MSDAMPAPVAAPDAPAEAAASSAELTWAHIMAARCLIGSLWLHDTPSRADVMADFVRWGVAYPRAWNPSKDAEGYLIRSARLAHEIARQTRFGATLALDDPPPAPHLSVRAAARVASGGLRCRCCLGPLDTAIQPGLVPGRDLTLITCRNPACKLHDHTLTTLGYESLDLSRYGASEHPAWALQKAKETR